MKKIVKNVGMIIFEIGFTFLTVWFMDLDQVWYSITEWIRYNDIVCSIFCVAVLLGGIHLGRWIYSRILKIKVKAPKKLRYITTVIKLEHFNPRPKPFLIFFAKYRILNIRFNDIMKGGT